MALGIVMKRPCRSRRRISRGCQAISVPESSTPGHSLLVRKLLSLRAIGSRQLRKAALV
jgi:hypothetical protein